LGFRSSGDFPLSLTRHNLGLFGALAIIGLRLTIGFHFFSEGLDKLLNPRPFTAPFLSAAKGPFAPLLRSYVWDADGLVRLGYTGPGSKGMSVKPTEKHWDEYTRRAITHYGFDEQQKKRAADILKRYQRDLRQFARDYREDIAEYFRGVERRNQQLATRSIQQVDSLRGQSETWQSELRKKGAPLLAQVDSLWVGLERDLYALVKSSKSPASREKLAIGTLQPYVIDAGTIDRIVPWFDLFVGLSLIAGLLTRVGAVLGAAFLAMVAVSQFPGATGAIPTWPQWIEMFALLSLAAVNAGQYGGLDFLVRAARAKCCPSKRQS